MARRLGSRDVVWLALLTGTFVFLCVNVLLGMRGFHRPHPGLLWRVLEAPGIALGWGGVALLVLAIPYGLLTWMRGQGPGTTVAVVGALVVAFGLGGLAGALSDPATAGGGRLAGSVAALLREVLGPLGAGILFALMCLPGLLLALAPLLFQGAPGVPARGPAPAGDRPRLPSDGPSPRGTTVRPRYPERRLGPDGEELPMELGGNDVGPIRIRSTEVADPQRPDPGSIAALPASSTRAPRPIGGIRYADEGAQAAEGAEAVEPPAAPPASPDEPVAERLADGVRFAPTEALTAEEAPVSAWPAADEVGDPIEAAPTPAAASEGLATWDAGPPAPLRAAEIEETSPLELEVDMSAEDPSEPSEAEASPPPPPPPSPPPSPAPPEELPLPARAPEEVAASASRYRRRLAETGLIADGPPPELERAHKPARPRPRSPREGAGREAIAGLFSSLPLEELPPVGTSYEEPALGAAHADEAARGEAPVDAPGQTRLFEDAVVLAPGGRHPASRDPLYEASVAAALERGSASLVLLKRRLGVGYARAALLMEALVAEGILGEMTASGSRPTLISAAEYAERARRT